MSSIVTIESKKDEKFLRKKTDDFDFSKFSKKDTYALVIRMKKAMHEAQGIGLSANQIGLNLKVFVAEVPNSKGELKFYAVFNPKIDKTDNEKDSSEEGCLSIPGKYGIVPRYKKILITGFDKNGRNLKIKGWGLIAKVFQHEIDHLNGLLFIDRTKNVYEVPKTEHKH